MPAKARHGGAPPAGTRISGPAHVTDGDTIVIGEVKIRLEGIDAPESGQTCGRAWLGTWPCGQEATRHLELVTDGREVECVSTGTDRYGRMLGLCTTAGLDINADMVRNGLAWAFVRYSQRYIEEEAEARARRAGIWQGQATPAWVWRAQQWAAAASQTTEDAPQNCLIKGNITRGGRIYHMPWSPWYARTRIEPARGERWFCNEAEAEAAGWRPAGYH